jgi:alpha-galactosidase
MRNTFLCVLSAASVYLAAVARPAAAEGDASGGLSKSPARFVTATEIDLKDQWVKKHLLGKTSDSLPFSFVFDSHGSEELLTEWPKKSETTKLDGARTRHAFTWTDPKTGLEVRCVVVDYSDFPTVEWTLYFRNAGKADTPILSDIRSLDAKIALAISTFDRAIVHYNRGSTARAIDYEPLTAAVTDGAKLVFTPNVGRPTDGIWPYFNLQYGSEGRLIVVGWPGKWSASFELQLNQLESIQNVHVAAGQELFRAKLHPGEEVRSPLMVQQFYRGDWQRAQNAWRRWMVAHNLPRPGGNLPSSMLTPCSSHQFAEMTKADEASQKTFIDRYVEERIKIDYWWMDAGWYPCKGNWWNTGTWEVDKTRFPNGLRAISDYARSKGIKTIVWFEPERCQPDTWLFENRKEWLLDGPLGKLLNLGNPEALKWAIQHFGDLVAEQGIDLYRQDHNINPLPHWRNHDARDRQGITENAHVTGYLAYWDGLSRRFPNMLIDACSGGGRRNDLETMRRSVPLLRSDYLFEPIGQPCQTYGLAYWLPYYGTGQMIVGSYGFRSGMCAGNIPCWDMRDKNLDYPLLRKLTSERREVADCYLGDFYPLTPYSLESAAWMAWQFDLPEKGEGLVQAFRRDKSDEESKTFKLQGLEPDAVYTVKNFDEQGATKMTGRDLGEQGIAINIKEKPGAVVVAYQKES